MTTEDAIREQAITAIGEYLRASEICIDTVKSGGGLGYAATLLLLCAADAIGHGVLPDNGDFTRLDVLADPLFDQVLSPDQARQVKNWYRHLLAHTATMAIGVHLEPGAQGMPFEFDSMGAPVLIRVGKLHEIVSTAWGRVEKAKFNPPGARGKQPDLTARPLDWGTSLSHAASGVTSILGSASARTP